MDVADIPEKVAGDTISHDEFNAIRNELLRLRKWSVAAPLQFFDHGAAGFGMALGADVGGPSDETIGTDVGQVHIMVTGNQDGWEIPFAVNSA
jgi:hypothetical protein